MSTYGASAFSFNVASGTPAWEIRTNSTTRCSILEMGITALSATSIALGLGRPAARGTILPGYSFPLIPEERTDGASPSQTLICLAWQIAPTVPAQFYRRIFNNAGIGNGIIWTFARGLIIPVDGSMVLWNNAGGPQLNTWILAKE
jgi:hypothetical protein